VLKGTAADNDTTRILKHYLSRRDMGAAFDVLGKDEDLVAAFAWRAAFLTFEALKHRDEEKNSWNSLLVDFWRLSTAHSQYMVVKNFYEALGSKETTSSLDQTTLEILHKLFRLYALNTLSNEGSEFFSSAAVTIRQITLTRTIAVMKLLEEIRPHAVRLVDAWNFPDWQLDSSLGKYDGKVYEDLFRRARYAPLRIFVVPILISTQRAQPPQRYDLRPLPRFQGATQKGRKSFVQKQVVMA
jgi:acyl-CoA oxidase